MLYFMIMHSITRYTITRHFMVLHSNILADLYCMTNMAKSREQMLVLYLRSAGQSGCMEGWVCLSCLFVSVCVCLSVLEGSVCSLLEVGRTVRLHGRMSCLKLSPFT